MIGVFIAELDLDWRVKLIETLRNNMPINHKTKAGDSYMLWLHSKIDGCDVSKNSAKEKP
jgi:hypothetical protein